MEYFWLGEIYSILHCGGEEGEDPDKLLPEGVVEPPVEERVVAGGGHGGQVAEEEGQVVEGPAAWARQYNSTKCYLTSIRRAIVHQVILPPYFQNCKYKKSPETSKTFYCDICALDGNINIFLKCIFSGFPI